MWASQAPRSAVQHVGKSDDAERADAAGRLAVVAEHPVGRPGTVVGGIADGVGVGHAVDDIVRGIREARRTHDAVVVRRRVLRQVGVRVEVPPGVRAGRAVVRGYDVHADRA